LDWHYFDPSETPLTADDIAADCGAAKGLFTLIASLDADVFSIEPLPAFLAALAKTFKNIGFEVNLIEGARKLTRELKPKIAITTYRRKGHAMEIADAVRSVAMTIGFGSKGSNRCAENQ
jgi:hypothetical protein